MAHKKVCKLDSDRFGDPIILLSLTIANDGVTQNTDLVFGAKTISLIGYSFMALPVAASDNICSIY